MLHIMEVNRTSKRLIVGYHKVQFWDRCLFLFISMTPVLSAKVPHQCYLMITTTCFYWSWCHLYLEWCHSRFGYYNGIDCGFIAKVTSSTSSIDDKFSWKDRVSSVCRKVFSRLGAMIKVRTCRNCSKREKYIRARDPFSWWSFHQNLNYLSNSFCSDSNLAGADFCQPVTTIIAYDKYDTRYIQICCQCMRKICFDDHKNEIRENEILVTLEMCLTVMS